MRNLELFRLQPGCGGFHGGALGPQRAARLASARRVAPFRRFQWKLRNLALMPLPNPIFSGPRCAALRREMALPASAITLAGRPAPPRPPHHSICIGKEAIRKPKPQGRRAASTRRRVKIWRSGCTLAMQSPRRRRARGARGAPCRARPPALRRSFHSISPLIQTSQVVRVLEGGPRPATPHRAPPRLATLCCGTT